MMKKIISLTVGIFLLISILSGLALFLPNEIHFKIALAQNKPAEAQKTWPKWEIIAQNKSLGTLYKNKQYEDLWLQAKKISEQKCSLKAQTLSEFCSNIFYLKGLTQYQLGKGLENSKQKPLFQAAILDFTKVMTMTAKPSQAYVWSEENIEFIENKFKETQVYESKKESSTEDKEQEQSGQYQDPKTGKSRDQKDSSGEASSPNSENGKNKDSNSKKAGNTEDKNTQEQGETKTVNAIPPASRLPQNMQQALEKKQTQLEADQQNSQEGFNRSKSAAEKNKVDRSDPLDMFSNNPFFQNFFGNNLFPQNPFNKNYLQKQIQDPNQKDW